MSQFEMRLLPVFLMHIHLVFSATAVCTWSFCAKMHLYNPYIWNAEGWGQRGHANHYYLPPPPEPPQPSQYFRTVPFSVGRVPNPNFSPAGPAWAGAFLYLHSLRICSMTSWECWSPAQMPTWPVNYSQVQDIGGGQGGKRRLLKFFLLSLAVGMPWIGKESWMGCGALLTACFTLPCVSQLMLCHAMPHPTSPTVQLLSTWKFM